ncbi:helix-turn-helix transcriptional regulator [Mycolicibacterium austroafricanum]|uniref:helix-turn-helix transcriptional regulator n=1 Tax=Mycolicibacterium austroafricanum TaxID=39687 RepID=UPI001CA3411C|nr:LuxR family transcriptional regulator [Mycolicibacterium austroafricanum]QZT61003.1 LuxR C-terminal-related transcriptional regulator [Mycolicibacterium austroafricanum]
MHLSWPLIGRSAELRSIEAALSAPDVSGIVISGVAGVGKSRVAREAMSTAESRNCETRLAIGTHSGRTVPLGAFAAWALPGVGDPVELLRGVIASLTATPSASEVLIVVDDVHLLDELSAFVVNQIVQRDAAKLILTVRDAEPVPAAVQEIWRVGRFDRLSLQPLTPEKTSTLVSATLGAAVDPCATQRLWELTRGNALYLRHIVEQEITDGRFALHNDGNWRWLGDMIVPPSLVEFVESSVGALPTPVGDVVDALAVGEPIELAALARITDRRAIEDAETRGLITLEPTVASITVRLAHPIYGEVRRRRAPATKLRRLRGLIAGELAESDAGDEIHVLVRRATLSLDSDLTPDIDVLTKAAHGAVWLADLGLADRLADAAVRAGGGLDAEFVRAHALSWLGRGEDADAVLTRIDPAGLAGGDRARLAFLRASNMLWALGDPPRAKALIDDASRTVPSHERSYIDAFLTVYWFAMDQPDAAMSACEGLETDRMPAVVGAELAWALATIDADAGRTAAAVRTSEAGYSAVARSLDAPHMRFNIADSHVSALLLAGRIDDAATVAARVQQQAADLPGAAQLLGTAVAGRASLAAGDVRSACAFLERATIGLSTNHSLGWGYRYLIPRIQALATSGYTDAAAAALVSLDDMQRPFRLLDYEQSLARAWVVAGQGAVSEAIGIVRSAAEKATSQGRFAAEVLCLQTAVQFGDRRSARRLHDLESLVEGPRVRLASRFAEALRDDNAAQLAILSAEFEHMGDLVAAVDTAAHAALAYRRHEKRGSAMGCAARAAALAERSGARTPALLSALQPLPLTDREREIVMLIGKGMSSREIAERLTLSVRTVESHVYRAMSKTGTTSRRELAALLPTAEDRSGDA